MATYSIQGDLWIDDLLEDGYVRVEPTWGRMFMTLATYRALFTTAGALPRLWEALDHRPGIHLLPRAVIETEAAGDLRLGLSLVDPVEQSAVCVYPPCSLTAEVLHSDGFWLCIEHAALMADWDSLTSC